MSIFDVLTMIGGLSLFLFGMNLMGEALERRAGSSLRTLLGKLTTNKFIGLFTGLGVTAVIQSSSATTVMVVGFVNSGLINLRQAINVIMGANIGTTVTSWILSLSGIDSGNVFVKLLKPSSFTPILALIGIVLYMFVKNDKKKDTGLILLGFATLMFGMDAMTGAVKGLADVPAFQEMFIMFKNPILGVLVGAVLTAIIQSSSASVGVLQALAATGQVSFGAAIPIIMGQNIGTCITAILSSVGANKNAKRAAFVHLFFNVIGTLMCLVLFYLVRGFFPVLDDPASLVGIAVCHSAFNIFCTLVLLPMAGLLEKLVIKLIPDSKMPEVVEELDERLLATPPVALERCQRTTEDMAKCAVDALLESIDTISDYRADKAESILEKEELSDHYEDILGTYLVKLSSYKISDADSAEAAKLLKIIGDFERISDHAVNVLESSEEMYTKKLSFSPSAAEEMNVLTMAVKDILQLTYKAFIDNDIEAAEMVEPLEQVIDKLKERLRSHHIVRLQRDECSIEAGFVWQDLLTNLERVSDHCSNIAGCIIDIAQNNMNIHENLRIAKVDNPVFKQKYDEYREKYKINSI